MALRGLVRGTLLAGLCAGVVAVSSPAWANTTIQINEGNVPTTAAAFGTHLCSANQGGGPFAGKDVWVFVLPGDHSTNGDFVLLTANFSNGSVTITAAANPGNFSNGGPATSKAWIVTTAGVTLQSASAEITGTADFFNLTHTCPASSTPTPSKAPSKQPSGGAATGGGGSQGNSGLFWGIGALAAATVGIFGLTLVRRRLSDAA